ncbi:hypothetical protein CGRA01v4_01901 [Colletotrichum graminicola]|nr:hypothetical protein CGRA01v4_01901 [Colletotrichum graminicola]
MFTRGSCVLAKLAQSLKRKERSINEKPPDIYQLFTPFRL